MKRKNLPGLLVLVSLFFAGATEGVTKELTLATNLAADIGDDTPDLLKGVLEPFICSVCCCSKIYLHNYYTLLNVQKELFLTK